MNTETILQLRSDSGIQHVTTLPTIMEPSYDADQPASDGSTLKKTDIIAQMTPLTCNANATSTEGSRDMAGHHSSSHLDTLEKNKPPKRSLAETCKDLSCERGKNDKINNCVDGGLSLNTSRSSCRDGLENAKRFKESGINSSCNKHVDIVIDNVEVAGRLNTGAEVTGRPPKVAMIDTDAPLPSLSPHLETGNNEEPQGERKDQNQSLSDSNEEDDSADLPHKSSVPRFVYGICNTSSFKRRKKEAAKSQKGRKSSTLSSSFSNEEPVDEKRDSSTMFCDVNGHQSESGSTQEMVEHRSDRTREQTDPSIPLQTSKSNQVDCNNETAAPQFGSTNPSVPSELSLQDEVLDLSAIPCKKGVPASRDSREQDTEHISYIAEFREEGESSTYAGDGEQGQGKSSKRGFLSITGLIQKRRTPMMKRYKMKDIAPETGDEDERRTERHLSSESDHPKSMASHPMNKYYERIQRDSQSVRPSEGDVSDTLGDSSSEKEDNASHAGPLEKHSTERPLEGASNREYSMAHHSMVKYYQLLQGLSKTADRPEPIPQDEVDTNSTTQEKEEVPSIQPAEVEMENDPNKRFKCKVCGRGFRQSQGLTAHKKIHSEERPFACQHCDLTFRVKQNLITHVRTHTGEKPHSCEVCGRGFRQQSTLVRHLRSHTGERPYKCEYCQRTFSQRHVMMNHVKIHTGEKPYTCELCGKDFKEQHNLVRHVRTHTGEKPYTCEECGNKFTQKNHLIRHAKVHIPKKHTI